MHDGLRRSWARGWAVGIGLIIACVVGCGTTRPADLVPKKTPEPRMTQDELRARLREFRLAATTAIESASEAAISDSAIASSSHAREVRREVVRWKLNVGLIIQQAIARDDAQVAFIDTWGACEQHRLFVAGDDGAELLGPAQPYADAAAERMSASVERIAAVLLPQAELERARTEIRHFAREEPLDRGYVRDPYLPPRDEPAAPLAWLVDKPLSPFRTIGDLDDGVRALEEFNALASRFEQTVVSLPKIVRWEVELALHDLERRETIRGALESFAKLSQSAAALTEQAERLPTRVGDELTRVMDEFDQRQGQMQTTIREMRSLTESLERLTARAEPLVGGVERTTAELTRAGEAWTGLVRVVDEWVPRPAPASEPAEGATERLSSGVPEGGAPAAEAPPFEIGDYRDTAHEVARAGEELRGLVVETRSLAGSPELEQWRTAVDEATTRLFWRGAILVTWTVVLIAGAVIVVRRLRGGSA